MYRKHVIIETDDIRRGFIKGEVSGSVGRQGICSWIL